MKLKTIIRWILYGVVFAGIMYAISRTLKGCQTQHTEPETQVPYENM